VGDNDDDDGNNDDGDDNNDDDGDGDGAMGSGATGYNHDNDLGSGLALACCSIVAPPAASPCALSICISVRSKMFLRSISKIKIKTGVTWNLACSFEI